MFSRDIVRSDAFLDLPISSQALYFHLGMEADDRGYVNNPKSVIKMVGSSVGDLEQLVNKKFILLRDENLILIKHWKINNLIKTDRFKETTYTEDLKKLFFDANNAYTEHITKTPCLDYGTQMEPLEPQYSIGKYSIGKYSIVKNSINNNILELLNNNLDTNLIELDYINTIEYLKNISTKYNTYDILQCLKDYLHIHNNISNYNSLHSYMTNYLNGKELF